MSEALAKIPRAARSEIEDSLFSLAAGSSINPKFTTLLTTLEAVRQFRAEE